MFPRTRMMRILIKNTKFIKNRNAQIINNKPCYLHTKRPSYKYNLYNHQRTTYHYIKINFSTSTQSSNDHTNKIYPDCKSAILASGLKSGDTVCSGGFGICGIPSGCIDAIAELGKDKINNLTVVSNNCGIDSWGNGIMLGMRTISQTTFSFTFTFTYFGGT